MKRLISASLIITFALVFASCGNKEVQSDIVQPTPTVDGSPAIEEKNDTGGIETDEKLLTVEITLPASLFEGEDMSDFDSDQYAAEQGFTKAVLNEDGSVTVTMTKAKHKELLNNMTAEYEKTFAEMVGSEETPYIKAISHAEQFENITVDVDRAAYESALFDVTPFTLGLAGMMYRAFTEGDPKVEVVIRDADTKEVISTTVYPDALEQQ
jgi:hypothetical protein